MLTKRIESIRAFFSRVLRCHWTYAALYGFLLLMFTIIYRFWLPADFVQTSLDSAWYGFVDGIKDDLSRIALGFLTDLDHADSSVLRSDALDVRGLTGGDAGISYTVRYSSGRREYIPQMMVWTLRKSENKGPWAVHIVNVPSNALEAFDQLVRQGNSAATRPATAGVVTGKRIEPSGPVEPGSIGSIVGELAVSEELSSKLARFQRGSGAEIEEEAWSRFFYLSAVTITTLVD